MVLPRLFLQVSALRLYFPGSTLSGFPTALMPLEEALMFSVQCLLLGLHGYLIHFAPLAFIPHCQNRYRKMPSLLLVQSGSTHLTVTPIVLLTSPGL